MDCQQRAATPEEEMFTGYNMLVVDPLSRKLTIPIEYISETLARFRQATPSLCMLFLNGRCRQGVNCHQVHAEPSVVIAMRAQVQHCLMCCLAHGDRASFESHWADRYEITFTGGSGQVVPLHRLAATNGLYRLINDYEKHSDVAADEKVRLAPNVSLICRLHGQDRCRFGEECKFLHICKELLWGEVAAAGISPQSSRRLSGSQGYDVNSSHNHSFSNQRYYAPSAMSCDSLISMDLTATPPMTPTSPANSPVIKPSSAGDSWSYEPYNFNPIPMMPPALDAAE